MAQPMEDVATMIMANKSAGDVLASSSAWMVITGAEELTLQITTGSLPVVKNGAGIEHSIATGLKMKGRSKNQTLNDLPITIHEREGLTGKRAIENLQLSNMNGTLRVDFWIGEGELQPTEKWGTVTQGLILTDDNPEFDTEGSESPMSRTFTLAGHYIPDDCKVNESARGTAKSAIDKINRVDGLSNC